MRAHLQRRIEGKKELTAWAARGTWTSIFAINCKVGSIMVVEVRQTCTIFTRNRVWPRWPMTAVSGSEFILFSLKINRFEVAPVAHMNFTFYCKHLNIVVSTRRIVMFCSAPFGVCCDRITHGTWLEHGSVKRKMQFTSPDTCRKSTRTLTCYLLLHQKRWLSVPSGIGFWERRWINRRPFQSITREEHTNNTQPTT